MGSRLICELAHRRAAGTGARPAVPEVSSAGGKAACTQARAAALGAARQREPGAVSGLERAALVVVDVQRAFDDEAFWGPRNNPASEANIAALVCAWTARRRPLVLVRHDSVE